MMAQVLASLDASVVRMFAKNPPQEVIEEIAHNALRDAQILVKKKLESVLHDLQEVSNERE